MFCSLFCLAQNPPKLLSWYKLDGNFKDSSGNNRHLTPLSKANIFSDAPQIIGAKNLCFGPTAVKKAKYGAIGPVLPLDNKKGFTISGFIRLPNGNSYGGRFFGSGTDAQRSPGALFFSSWGIINSKVGKNKTHSYKRMDDNEWHHYTIVVPKQGAVSKYTVYFDGQKAYSSDMEYLSNYGKFFIGIINITQDYGIRIDEVKALL